MPESEPQSKCQLLCHINVRIALTIIDIIIGISNFLTYALQFHNWSALTLTVIVTGFAFQTLIMFVAEKNGKIKNWRESSFRWIMWSDMVLGFIFLLIFIFCFVYAGITRIQFTNLYGENLWFTGLWATAIVKYTWQNAFLARNYRRKLISDKSIEETFRI